LFTPSILQVLERHFKDNMCPSERMIKRFAQSTNLDEKKIQAWFTRQRHIANLDMEAKREQQQQQFDVDEIIEKLERREQPNRKSKALFDSLN
jgi:hypothetical protein